MTSRRAIIPITAPPETWRAHKTGLMSVPGEAVSALTCPVPAGLKEAAARNVALNAARDMVAGPPEAHHFVYVAGSGDIRVVLAMTRSERARWKDIIAKQPTRVIAVLPDYLCLPWQDGQISIDLPVPDRLVVRTGHATGFAAERSLGLQMLDLHCRQSAGITKEIVLVQGATSDDAGLLENLSKWDVPIRTAPADPAPAPVNLLSEGGQGGTMAGLGVTSPQGRARLQLLAVLLVGALVWSAHMQLDIRNATNALAEQRQANLATARRDFGLSGPILDMEVQVQRAIEAREQSAAENQPRLGFPDLLMRIGPVIAERGTDVSELHYNDTTLRLAVRVADFAALDALRRALAQSGVDARVSRSVGGGDGVQAELLIASPEGRAG